MVTPTPPIHDVEAYKVRFDTTYVLKKTKVPLRAEDTPLIIGWSGPARSGTTALLYLLASHPDVDRAYFQPQKTIFRNGGPVFELKAEDNIVCMKEVFGGDLSLEGVTTHDPIDMLLKAGVPPAKIVWVTILRDPMQVFSSVSVREPDPQPEILAASQAWSISLFNKHRKEGIKTIPYVYELARDYGDEGVRALFRQTGLDPEKHDLVFDHEAIARKVVPGQMADQGYFDANIKATLERRKYTYSENSHRLPDDVARRVKTLCDDDYQSFKKLAQKELGL